jgi:hypothetical protein
MLTLYLSCLLVGGVFVGLSVFSGLDKDADFAADSDFDGDFDADAGVSGEAHVDHASLAEASHGVDDSRRRRKRMWLPFLSFRFWTFGAAFFGLTGVVLSVLDLSVEPITLGLAGGVGLAVGAAASSIVRALRRPVGARKVTGRDFEGAVGELLLPLKAAGVSKVRVVVSGAAHELVAIPAEAQALDRGARVVVLGLDPEGRARVAPEEQLYALEDS